MSQSHSYFLHPVLATVVVIMAFELGRYAGAKSDDQAESNTAHQKISADSKSKDGKETSSKKTKKSKSSSKKDDSSVVTKKSQQSSQPQGLAPGTQFSVEHSLTNFSDLVLPSQCSTNGMMYAGEMLALMDIVAGTCAFKHCHGPSVTVTIDSVSFLLPAYAENVLSSTGRITAAFGSSLEVEVEVYAENCLVEGSRQKCCTGRLVFVSMDNQKRPLKVPGLVLGTTDEQARAEAALRRKQERAEERKRLADVGQLSWWKQQWPKEEKILNDLSKHGHIQIVNVSDSASEISKAVMPQDANALNIAFGGRVMQWMEQAGAIVATRLTRKAVITAGFDRMSFQKPAKVGSLLTLQARATRVFGKSLEVQVRVYCFSGGSVMDPDFTNEGYFSFTTINEEKQPVAVGLQVRPSSDEEKKSYCEAMQRREKRMKDK